MKPILLATDGSPSAEAAADEALALAQALDARVVGVCVAQLVLPPSAGYFGYGEATVELRAAEQAHVETVLARLAERAADAGVECTPISLEGPAADAICRAAQLADARMIVIGSHGWGRVGRILHGSVSTAVLHQARCPVHVVHGADVSAERQDLVGVGG